MVRDLDLPEGDEKYFEDGKPVRVFDSNLVREPVSQIDMVPTLLELMGRARDARLSGRSLAPLMKGRGASIGQEGHPPGTHVMGRDIDLGYYQIGTPNNRLRPICQHIVGETDQARAQPVCVP